MAENRDSGEDTPGIIDGLEEWVMAGVSGVMSFSGMHERGLKAERRKTVWVPFLPFSPMREKVPSWGRRGDEARSALPNSQPSIPNTFRSRSTRIRCVPATAVPRVLMSCMNTHSLLTCCGVISIIA